MSGGDPIRLSPVDHVVIHATCALLIAGPGWDNAEMVRSILRDALPDVTDTNPALRDLIAAARAIVGLGQRKSWEFTGAARDYHARKCAVAWDAIRERYEHGR